MFKGFQNIGHSNTTVRPSQLFEAFPTDTFDNFGQVGGLVTSGLIAHFDPSFNITLNGNTVSSWSDTSNTYTISQGIAVNQPGYNITNNYYRDFPYLTFDGVNDQLSASNILGIGSLVEYTIIVLARYATNVTNARLATFALGSTGEYKIGENTSAGASYRHSFNNGSGAQFIVYAPLDTAMHLHALQINRLANRIVAQYDGNAAAANMTIVAGTTNYSTGTFILGGVGGQREVLDLFFYDKILTSSEYITLYNYVKYKYAL